MSGFVGRARELGDLREQFAVVEHGGRDARGVAVLLRGRRRVGKSRLVETFADGTGAPYVAFQAARGAPAEQEYAGIAAAIAASSLPNAAVADGNTPATLTSALTLLAAALPGDQPSIVVIDEAPWLLEGIPGGAGELQRVWDRALSRKPVLLLLLGSDLAMMEELTRSSQPFHGRAVEMILQPLSPADIARMTGLGGMAAFDAFLVTGGQPLIAQEWRHGETVEAFLTRSFSSSLSALVASGTRVLDGEFPEGDLTRQVLTAIGAGGRAFSKIQQAGGGWQPTSLTRVLDTLIAKRVVTVDVPLSTKASRASRYRVADPALRFWLPFVESALTEVDRGRPDLAMRRAEAGFASWCGRAIEPVVREGLSRLLPDTPWAHVREVGGWWPRSNTPEVDLVGADRRPANTIAFAGTIKWRESLPVNAGEIAGLTKDLQFVPGAGPDTAIVAVCPAGVDAPAKVAAAWTAEDLLAAWP